MDVWTENVRLNNYRAARVAQKAYLDDPIAHAAQRRNFEKEMKNEFNANVYWWSNRNASGVIIDGSGGVLIGVAGTNDKGDAKSDAHLTPVRINGGWSGINGVELGDDVAATQPRTTAGFAGYTALAANGIFECTSENGIILGGRKVAFAAHSLGGACVQLLQLFKPFEDSTSYTFGGARAFTKISHVPVRKRFATMRLTDPVIYNPAFICKHADSTRLYVAETGLRAEIDPLLYPVIAVINAVCWTAGLLGNVLRLCRLPVPAFLNIAYGHDASRYVEDCQ